MLGYYQLLGVWVCWAASLEDWAAWKSGLGWLIEELSEPFLRTE